MNDVKTMHETKPTKASADLATVLAASRKQSKGRWRGHLLVLLLLILAAGGAAYLYVRPDLRSQLRPAATGWMAHRQPFEFQSGHIAFAEDAYRFLNGTPNIPALYSARSGYEIVNQIGVEAIRSKSVRQTQRLIELADEAGFAVGSCRDPLRRGGVVVIDVPNGKEVTRELARREVLVDYRPNAGIRIAPHFYTSDDELDRAMAEIQSAAHLFRRE